MIVNVNRDRLHAMKYFFLIDSLFITQKAILQWVFNVVAI